MSAAKKKKKINYVKQNYDQFFEPVVSYFNPNIHKGPQSDIESECSECDEYPVPESDDTEEYNGNGWLNLCTAEHPWDEERRPSICPIDESDIPVELVNELNTKGYLSRMVIATGMSNMDLIPGKLYYGLTKLQLPGKKIKDISALSNYKLLQYIDLSYNNIQNISPLRKMSYLMVLDVSHNQISKFDLFHPPPWFLSYLNLSSNHFTEMPDFTPLWSLKHINLSYNNIDEIKGIDSLRYLRYLNLSYNHIEIVQITNMSLRELNLSHNRIRTWIEDSYRSCLLYLKILNISHNRLASLDFFFNSYNLQELNIAFNRISCETEYSNFNYINTLQKLWINGNKIGTIIKDFKGLIIYFIPRLRLLNGILITPKDRASSIYTYGPNILLKEMKAFWMNKYVNDAVAPPPIGTPMTNIDKINPIVVLVGTIGNYCCKLVQMLVRKYPKCIKLCKIHTTLPCSLLYTISNHFKEFIHVSQQEFDDLTNSGKFVSLAVRCGYFYGISLDELKSDGRICILATGIVGGLNLYWHGLDPILILITTNDNNLFVKRVKEFYNSFQNFVYEHRNIRDSQIIDQNIHYKCDLDNDTKLRLEERRYSVSSEKAKNLLEMKLTKKARPVSEDMEESDSEEDTEIMKLFLGYPLFQLFKKKKVKEQTVKVIDVESYPDFVGFSEDTDYSNEDEFVQSMLLAKKQYEEIHSLWPGIFKSGIASDNLTKALRKIVHLMKTVYQDVEEEQDESEKYKDTEAYQELVMNNLNPMLKSIFTMNGELPCPDYQLL